MTELCAERVVEERGQRHYERYGRGFWCQERLEAWKVSLTPAISRHKGWGGAIRDRTTASPLPHATPPPRKIAADCWIPHSRVNRREPRARHGARHLAEVIRSPLGIATFRQIVEGGKVSQPFYIDESAALEDRISNRVRVICYVQHQRLFYSRLQHLRLAADRDKKKDTRKNLPPKSRPIAAEELGKLTIRQLNEHTTRGRMLQRLCVSEGLLCFLPGKDPCPEGITLTTMDDAWVTAFRHHIRKGEGATLLEIGEAFIRSLEGDDIEFRFEEERDTTWIALSTDIVLQTIAVFPVPSPKFVCRRFVPRLGSGRMAGPAKSPWPADPTLAPRTCAPSPKPDCKCIKAAMSASPTPNSRRFWKDAMATSDGLAAGVTGIQEWGAYWADRGRNRSAQDISW